MQSGVRFVENLVMIGDETLCQGARRRMGTDQSEKALNVKLYFDHDDCSRMGPNGIFQIIGTKESLGR